MAKRFKLKLSLPSFQLCRPKKPSSFLKTDFPPPPTATYLYSPINPKSFEIAYPANFPDPPPTTPTYNPRSPFSKRLQSKVIPLIKTSCNSPSSYHNSSYYNNYPPHIPIKGDKNCDDLSVNSTNCDFSCSEESNSLFSSSGSLDDFSSFSINGGTVKKKSKNVKAAGKLKRYGSNKFGTIGEVVENNNNKGSNKSVFRRLMPPCAVEGKVKESFVVVTRSDDPYEDFKRSMLEMILEKQMFEAKDLEELLQCFLSLNSRHHHPVIVAAFTEIWEVLFL